MRTFIITTVFLFGLMAATTKAQDAGKREFLLGGDRPVSISGFGAPIIEFSSIDGDLAVSTGGGGAVLFNQCFFVGAYGLGTVNPGPNNLSIQMRDFDLSVHTYSNLRRTFAHGGLWLGYIHNTDKMVHLALSTKIGGGAVGYFDSDFHSWDADLGWDVVFVFTPQVEVELNMTEWFKINLGVGYRFVSGVNETYTDIDGNERRFFDSGDFTSPQVSLSLLFGGFGM